MAKYEVKLLTSEQSTIEVEADTIKVHDGQITFFTGDGSKVAGFNASLTSFYKKVS